MSIEIEVMAEDIAWLREQQAKFPEVVRAHFAGAVTWMKNRFAKVMKYGGGFYGVPKFHRRAGVTMRLHGKRWGGNIKPKALAKAWRKNGKQIIGIPDNNPATVTFGRSLQTAETRRWHRKERRYMHRREVFDLLHPQYTRPARPVVAEFAADQHPAMVAEIRKRVGKTLQSEEKIQQITAKQRARDAQAIARAAKRAERAKRARHARMWRKLGL